MKMRHPKPALNDTYLVILFVVLGIIVFGVMYIRIDAKTLRYTRWEGPSLILGLSDGYEYEASACIPTMKTNSGNYFQYIAFGFPLSVNGKQITTPIIIHCELTELWVDDFILPTP